MKCDEQPGTCNNCKNLELNCHWERSDSAAVLFPSSAACKICREVKSRCSRDQPKCSRCNDLSLECVYPSAKEKGGRGADVVLNKSQSPDPPVQHRGGEWAKANEMMSKTNLLKFIDAYFEKIYCEQSMSFFNQTQIYHRVETGTLPAILTKAIATLTARFVLGDARSNGDGGRLPALWSRDVKIALALESDRFSTSRLAAVLCLIHHERNSMRFASAWSLTAQASRRVIGMALDDTMGANLSWIQKETRRRLVWAAYCLDALGSFGLPQCTTLSIDLLNRSLPCDDHAFTFGQESVGPTLETLVPSMSLPSNTSVGMSAHFIFLVHLGLEIARYAALGLQIRSSLTRLLATRDLLARPGKVRGRQTLTIIAYRQSFKTGRPHWAWI